MKHFYKFFLALIIFFSIENLSAQDIIYKQDGGTLNGKIEEIGIDNIIYSTAGNQEISIKKGDIHKIVYQNGKEEIINPLGAEPQRQAIPVTEPKVSKPQKKEENDKPKITFDSRKVAYIAMHFGAAIPLQDAGSESMSNEKSLYASNGFNFNFEAGVYFSKYIGVGAKIFSMANNRAEDALTRDTKTIFIQRLNAEVTDGNTFQSSQLETKATADPFYFNGALLGLKGCLPLNRFSAEVGLWVGYASTTAGGIEVTHNLVNNTNFVTNSYPELSSSGLGLGIDLSLKFDISKRLFIAAQYEYLTHQAAYSSSVMTEYYSFDNTYLSFSLPAQTVSVATSNISLGLGFVFRKK